MRKLELSPQRGALEMYAHQREQRQLDRNDDQPQGRHPLPAWHDRRSFLKTVGRLFWYHPHAHGFVAKQMLGGMSGGLVVPLSRSSAPKAGFARLFTTTQIRHPATVQLTDALRRKRTVRFDRVL